MGRVGGSTQELVGVDHNKNKIGRDLLAFARTERHADRSQDWIYLATELMAENLRLYHPAFFPAFLSAVVADMALVWRLGPSPPTAGADDRPTL